MKRIVFAVAIALSWVGPASAAHWNVDAARSRLGFTVEWSGESFSASFRSWNADIDFDPAHLNASHASVDIDLASEHSDSPDNDDALKTPQGFAVVKFPTAHFRTTAFRHLSGDKYIATGTLDLHGISKSIALPFTLDMRGNIARMIGSTQVLRTDFGLGQGQWASPTPIAREVRIDVDLTATKTS